MYDAKAIFLIRVVTFVSRWQIHEMLIKIQDFFGFTWSNDESNIVWWSIKLWSRVFLPKKKLYPKRNPYSMFPRNPYASFTSINYWSVAYCSIDIRLHFRNDPCRRATHFPRGESAIVREKEKDSTTQDNHSVGKSISQLWESSGNYSLLELLCMAIKGVRRREGGWWQRYGVQQCVVLWIFAGNIV